MIRDDLSQKLIHLTRGDSPDPAKAKGEAVDRFEAIVNQRRILGGSGCIKGRFSCICFSEAPISKLSYILAAPSIHRIRYAPYGVMVEKKWLYQRGGRPVIYGPDADFEKLPLEMRYRHVQFDLTRAYPIDFTWEREWRLHAAELILDPSQVTLVVADRAVIEVFSNDVRSEWHFVALSDLGVSVEPL